MKDLATIKKDLAPVQQLLEQYRLDQLKKTQKGRVLIVIPILIFIGCLVGMFYFYPDYMLIFLVVMLLSAMAMVWFYLNAYLNHIEDYQKKFKSTLLQKMVQTLYPNMTYSPEKFISEEEFDTSGLFDTKAYEGYGGEDYFEGTISGLPVRFSEVDAKNISGKNTVTLFNGLLMIVDVKASFKGKTFVLPEKSENFIDRFNNNIQGQANRGELITFEHHSKFERHFAIYTNNAEEAKRILRPDMLEGILAVRKTFNSDLYLSFQDEAGYVYIAIDIGVQRNILEPNINESLSKDTKVLDRISAELITCFEIVKELPLNFEH